MTDKEQRMFWLVRKAVTAAHARRVLAARRRRAAKQPPMKGRR